MKSARRKMSTTPHDRQSRLDGRQKPLRRVRAFRLDNGTSLSLSTAILGFVTALGTALKEEKVSEKPETTPAPAAPQNEEEQLRLKFGR